MECRARHPSLDEVERFLSLREGNFAATLINCHLRGNADGEDFYLSMQVGNIGSATNDIGSWDLGGCGAHITVCRGRCRSGVGQIEVDRFVAGLDRRLARRIGLTPLVRLLPHPDGYVASDGRPHRCVYDLARPGQFRGGCQLYQELLGVAQACELAPWLQQVYRSPLHLSVNWCRGSTIVARPPRRTMP